MLLINRYYYSYDYDYEQRFTEVEVARGGYTEQRVVFVIANPL